MHRQGVRLKQRLSINNNPYEGLKQSDHNNQDLAVELSINNNPYEGLKQSRLIRA